MERSGFDPSSMGGDVLTELEIVTLDKFGLGQAEGGVGADIVLTPELLAGFERIKSGEFTIEATSVTAEICVDERPSLDGSPRNAARSAGGPVGSAHAHDLARGSENESDNEIGVVAKVTRRLRENGSSAKPHTDDHSSCGCGQCAQAERVYQTVLDKSDSIMSAVNALSDASEKLGSSSPKIEPSVMKGISRKAGYRLGQVDFFAEDRYSVLASATGGSEEMEVLTGGHEARAAVWASEPGKTIDSARVAHELGIEVFIANPWSFAETARYMNVSGYEEETIATEASLAAVNVATLSVLCSGKMPVLVV